MITELLSYLTHNIDGFLTRSPSETKCAFKKHPIAVILDNKKLSLYIDGQSVDTSRVYWRPKRDVALLRGAIKEGRKSHVVEVYGMSGFLRSNIKICVDGERLAGTEF